MLHRFFDAIHKVVHTSDFEAYYMRLHLEGLAGTPTADEARKEYSTYLGSKSKLEVF